MPWFALPLGPYHYPFCSVMQTCCRHCHRPPEPWVASLLVLGTALALAAATTLPLAYRLIVMYNAQEEALTAPLAVL